MLGRLGLNEGVLMSLPEKTAWFTRDRFGMFIHWGLYASAARHEWFMKRECLTPEQYRKYFDHFEPDLFDPAKWARAAKDAGMKYAVITAKHHEGFCLWDTKFTDYQAVKSPAGRDLLLPILEAFRAEGLKVGLYYSLLDWHHPQYTVDRQHPQYSNQDFKQQAAGRDMSVYAKYMRDQVEELLTGYGKIDLLWFDFSFEGPDGKGGDDWESDKLHKLVRRLQPEILINNRLDLPGSGDFVTPEQHVPESAPVDEQGQALVWEGCQTFSGSWGYYRDETSWKSVPLLIRMLVDHVSNGGNMLLNVGPTARGEFDGRALERLSALGVWMGQNSRAIYGCGPADFTAPRDCRYTQNGNRLYLHLLAWPFKAVHLPGLAGRVEYAQFLHDASELVMRQGSQQTNTLVAASPQGALTINLPEVIPDISVPVIELFLKENGDFSSV
jgi:alpha-L-fucosidase